ncbi:MAG: hypothetical protein M1834_008425 [Cirrosporium novae-zelandiae]|nr:MAG: hypothetical protein M1834_008425 [Cirrosporium novae-zelandiae]
MALTILYCVIFDAISLFQCTPVSLAWTRWDGQHKGVCRNINAQIWSCAAINIALDAATLILPLPELYKLALSTRRKIQILAMFSVGFFVTIISVIRLEVLVTFGNTQNVTWDYTSIGYWSTLEVHVAVVCACMPAIRSLFQNVFPKVFGHTQVASTGKTTGLSTNASNGKIVTTQRSQRHHEDGDFIPLVDMDTGKNEDLEFGQRPPGSSYTTTHAQNAGSTPTLETINVNRDTKSNHAS